MSWRGKHMEKDRMTDQAYNPYMPECEYVPDGEAHVFGDRVYVYGSHDRFGSSRYCPGDYVVYSSPVGDLSDWRCEGVIYRRRGYKNRFGQKCMWAPDVCRGPDGRYYLYFCFDWRSYVCVAVCDKPAGKYVFYGLVRHRDGMPYGKRWGDMLCFDPAVLCEGNGVWLYSGFSAWEGQQRMLRLQGIRNVDGTGGQVLRLGRDMLTIEEGPRMLLPGYKNSAGTGFEGHAFYEASSVRKVGERYYFVYSSELSHELCYAVSDFPDRGFVYGGTLISNGDIGLDGRPKSLARNYWGNNHGCIERINGQWYVFYHRQTGRTEQNRQACAERIEMHEDGSIGQAEMTSCGLNGAPLRGYGWYPAYIACGLRGAGGACKCAYGPFSRHRYRKHPCVTQEKRGGWAYQYVSSLRDGASVAFRYFDMRNPSVIRVRVRGGGGVLQVSFGEAGEGLAEIPVGPDRDWHDCASMLTWPAGRHEIYLTYRGKGALDILGFTLS